MLQLEALTSPADISPSFLNALAARVTRVLAASTASSAETLGHKLVHAVRKVISGAAPALTEAIQDTTRTGLPAQAYALGQLSFAQHLVASVAISRISDSFLSVLNERRWQPYLTELLKGERTNVELAKCVEEAEETVSRKIRALRGLGVTDYRREGTFVFNFLSPAAREVLESRVRSGAIAIASEYAPTEQHVAEQLAAIRATLPPYMKSAATFGMSHAN